MRGILGAATETFAAREGGEVRVTPGFEGLVAGSEVAGRAWVADPAGEVRGVPDGNRAVVAPEHVVDLGGRAYALGAKGVGARAAPYGDDPLSVEGFGELGGRWFAAEAWFGEAPWGAQGDDGGSTAAEVSALADGPSLNGFHLCPVVALVAVPDELLGGGRSRWWYRRWRGPFLQEHRLVPSDVRLFAAAERTLGSDPEGVLAAFGVDDGPAFDAFVEQFVRTGVAALTLYARSLRVGPAGPEGLAYGHVWLDKDGIVAPDGALHFADLEGLSWEPLRGRAFADVVRRQLDDHVYEWLFGLDLLLRAGERRAGRGRSIAGRRADLAARLELALDGDPFARCEVSADRVDLVVPDPIGDAPPARITLLDLA